jgi:hypothetical protein
MTLILNEIHLFDGFKNTLIVAAADQRITYLNGPKKYGKGKKLFKIEYLNGTISYCGYSFVYINNKYQLLSSWLPNFIKKQNACPDLKSFAYIICNELNKIMPKNKLRIFPSIFHICGYNNRGIPEFWHFSNCEFDPKKAKYVNMSSQFKEPFPDFLGRDALEKGWDGNNPETFASSGICSYRNGDFKVHAVFWENLDQLFEHLFSIDNNFTRPDNPEKLKEFIKFKLNFFGSIYRKWAKEKIVGSPFDVFILKPTSKNKIQYV